MRVRIFDHSIGFDVAPYMCSGAPSSIMRRTATIMRKSRCSARHTPPLVTTYLALSLMRGLLQWNPTPTYLPTFLPSYLPTFLPFTQTGLSYQQDEYHSVWQSIEGFLRQPLRCNLSGMRGSPSAPKQIQEMALESSRPPHCWLLEFMALLSIFLR